MRYLKLITMLPLSFLLFTILSLPAVADSYNINGDLSDWGVNLQKAYSGDSDADKGWIPNGHPNVDWIVENNIDPKYKNNKDLSYPDWTGYSAIGAHSKGTGSTSVIYEEPKLVHHDWWSSSNGRDDYYLQPAGGEPCDIEALYFDDDAQNMYIAIVTSLSPNGYTDEYSRHTDPGDIALDIDNKGNTGNYGYEYGIKTDTGLIRRYPTCTIPTTDFTTSKPYKLNPSSGSSIGPEGTEAYANLKYVKVTNAPEQVNYGSTKRVYENYIIEAKIPKNAIGNPTAGQTSNIHITMGCGNDVIELIPVTFKAQIPEFPSIALPVAAILGIIFILGRRNKD
jgi:hypothetical protein